MNDVKVTKKEKETHPKTYEAGNCFKGPFGTYMLCVVETNLVQLINLNGKAYYSVAVRVSNPMKITLSELERIQKRFFNYFEEVQSGSTIMIDIN